MNNKASLVVLLAGVVLGACLIMLGPKAYNSIKVRFLYAFIIPTGEDAWDEDFRKVYIQSSIDGSNEPAFWYPATGEEVRPLLVSFPTWSSGFSESDKLAELARANNWNYLRPNLRGPNNHPDSCLSSKVLGDIDDAIQFALDSGRVDATRIFISGESGGGHAALAAWLQSRHPLRAVMAWVPITDLSKWYWQCKDRGLAYADDILSVTASGSGAINVAEALRRSPLYMENTTTAQRGRLEIYAGHKDGYGRQTVPISHSLLFFNRIAEEAGYPELKIMESQMVDLLTRAVDVGNANQKIGGRSLLLERQLPNGVGLYIFHGGHEILEEYNFERMKHLSSQ